ncbi:unnamed protein product [Penicillium olsonii]|uniref:Nephrocystin 3-like N-terminal domain-containing protein n=1 Tax=Penicillium olsonii TaxID=99116 RepID=A0A9W4MPV1_PENOL|nr:unnamed protein product [Penicillium olsonii]
MLDRRGNVESCHPNTCKWILDLERYRSWMSEPRGLLWIKGKPGAGKSTLMAFLHGQLEINNNQGIQLDFFFTARGTELQRTPMGMFRSLLNQIFGLDSTIRPRIRKAYEERCRRFGQDDSKWEWPQTMLEQLFTAAILASASRQHVTVFVDALDEAGADSAQKLATYFHRILAQAKNGNASLRICISCRHYPNTGNSETVEIHVEKHNRKDIASYIKDSLNETMMQGIPSEYMRQKQMLMEKLIRQSEGVFQWVHLIMPLTQQRISDRVSLDDICCWLSEVPTDLEDMYLCILNDVIQVWNLKESFSLFQWLCLAERPLTVTEIRYALAASKAEIAHTSRPIEEVPGFIRSDIVMKQRLKALSGGLAEAVSSGDSEEIVQVIHQSASDFLRNKGLAVVCDLLNTRSLGKESEEIYFRSQAILYRSCLFYLAIHQTRAVISSMVYQAPDGLTHNYPFLVYATRNIFIHAEKAARSRASVLRNEKDILSQVIKHWGEVYRSLHPTGKLRPRYGTTVLHIASAANLVDILEDVPPKSERLAMQDDEGNTAFHLAARHGHIAGARVLREKAADCEAENWDGATPLIEAAKYGQAEFVEWILHDGASPDATTKEGESALYAASLRGDQIIIDVLLSTGADVNFQGGQYGNALQAAATRGNAQTLRLLLDAGADVNAQGGEYGNALYAAAAKGNTKIFRLLLGAGADVNAQGGRYGNALQATVTAGDSTSLRLLLDAGADVNAQGGKYGNALQAAAIVGSFNSLRLLLDAGADVNAQGGGYSNALQAAVIVGSFNSLRLLLDAGADVNAQGGEYGNALQGAVIEGSFNSFRLLLDAGADVNAQGGEYGSPFIGALYFKRLKEAEILLRAGASTLVADKFARTPLHFAASYNALDLLHHFPKLLLPVNKRDMLSQTPFHLAICLGHIEFATVLLQSGADPSISDGYGRNSLDWAIENEVLAHQIRIHWPSVVTTSQKFQQITVRQSIIQISQRILQFQRVVPLPLVRQLGHYLLFVGDSDSAQRLFRMDLNEDPAQLKTGCDICTQTFTHRLPMYRSCFQKKVCLSCLKNDRFHNRLHPNQKHSVLKVRNVYEKRLISTTSEMEELRKIVGGLLAQHVDGSGTERSNDSTPSRPSPVMLSSFLGVKDLCPGSGSVSIMCYLLVGLVAVLCAYWCVLL